MKTINFCVLLIVLLLSEQNTKAQPVLNTIEKHSIGSTYTYIVADTAAFTSGGAGANAQWEYSQLQTLPGNRTGQVMLPQQTGYENIFTNTNEVLKTSDGSFLFLDRKPDTLFLRGYRQDFGDLNIVYQQPQVFAITPFTYANAHSGQTKYSYTYNGQQFKGGGNYNILADAYGTLTVGGRTYTNVLRIKQTQTSADTLAANGMVVSRLQTVTYKWYNTYNGHALLTYDSVIVQTQGGTQNRSEIVYLQNASGAVGVHELTPSPIQAIINYDKILFNNLENIQPTKIMVYDIAGKLIAAKTLNTKDTTVYCTLPQAAKAGQLFIIRLHTPTKIHTLKLGVQ